MQKRGALIEIQEYGPKWKAGWNLWSVSSLSPQRNTRRVPSWWGHADSRFKKKTDSSIQQKAPPVLISSAGMLESLPLKQQRCCGTFLDKHLSPHSQLPQQWMWDVELWKLVHRKFPGEVSKTLRNSPFYGIISCLQVNSKKITSNSPYQDIQWDNIGTQPKIGEKKKALFFLTWKDGHFALQNHQQFTPEPAQSTVMIKVGPAGRLDGCLIHWLS